MTIVFALNKRIQLGYGSISTYIRPVELLPKVIVLQVSKSTMRQFIPDRESTIIISSPLLTKPCRDSAFATTPSVQDKLSHCAFRYLKNNDLW